MGEKTGIGWTDHTFNPVWGCYEVGPGCVFCYARTWAKRMGHDVWGQDRPLRTFGDQHWGEPLKWNKKAQAAGRRALVFCSSMADVLDKRWPLDVHARLGALIQATPMLEWQLVTKRIGMAETIFDRMFIDGKVPRNVWLIPTMVNQEEVDRDMPKLAAMRDRVKVLGISYEPALGPIDLDGWAWILDWIIIGGESRQRDQSGNAVEPRIFHVSWARDLLRWASRNSCAVYLKQLGARPISGDDDENNLLRSLEDKQAGANPDEWPADLRVREYPA